LRSQERLVFEVGDRLGDYRDRRFGFQTSLQQPFGNAGRLDLAYLWERTDIDGQTFDRSLSVKNLAGLNFNVLFDRLNDSEFPTSGLLGKVEFDWRSRALGSDVFYSRSIVELNHYFSPITGSTVGLTTWLGRVDGTAAPFYERFYTGGGHSLSFASTRFPGLARDEILSKRVGIVGISYRKLLRHFPSGLFDDFYLSLEYRAGLFSGDGLNSAGIDNPLHGFGVGINLDFRILGPLTFELGRTNQGGLKAYFSLGTSF